MAVWLEDMKFIVLIASVILQFFVQLQSSSHSTEFCTSRRLERVAVWAKQEKGRAEEGGGVHWNGRGTPLLQGAVMLI